MDSETKKLEILKLKVGNLVAQRQLVVQTLVVLIGGVVGLFFLPDTTIKYTIAGVGIMYIIILGKSLYYTINKINRYLNERNEE